ncbi:MAG: hypothetical protein PHO42_05655 [Candidatus Omnitrophica bacterium]|nr:hypothetical protein [Candidatus Omnitrophota bacterium]
MQRLFLILVAAFILVMLVFALVLNIMKQDMIKPQTKNETAAAVSQSANTQRPVGLRELERTKAVSTEGKEQVRPPKEKEYDLADIPVDEIKPPAPVIEEEAPEEGATIPQRTLNTQPPADKLRELKVKGAVIY